MKKFSLPSAHGIIGIVIILMAILTWFIPSGTYDFIESDNNILQPIPGTYHVTENNPQGIWDILLAPVEGFMAAVDIIFYIFIIGGFLAVVMKTGAINAGINHMIIKLKGRDKLLIPAIMIIFAICGGSFGLAQEIFPFFIILIPVFIAAGYDAVTGVAVVFVASTVGTMASIANPFSVTLASRFADISIGDGIEVRIILLILFTISGISYTMWYAEKVKRNPTKSVVYDLYDEHKKHFLSDTNDKGSMPALDTQKKVVLILFGLTFLVMIWAIVPFNELGIHFIPTLSWWLDKLSVLFLVSSIIIAVFVKMSEKEFLQTFIGGAGDLLGVALIVGMARGVTVIMDNAQITHTILNVGENIVANVPGSLFAVASHFMFMFLSLFIGSSSGLATLSMGIMAPMADFVEIPRHLVVTAFSTANSGLHLVNIASYMLLVSTSFGKIPIVKWLKFIWPLFLILVIITCVTLSIAATLY